jgi:hypothetical protein
MSIRPLLVDKNLCGRLAVKAHTRSNIYGQVMNIFGRFKQETIALGLGLGELK